MSEHIRDLIMRYYQHRGLSYVTLMERGIDPYDELLKKFKKKGFNFNEQE